MTSLTKQLQSAEAGSHHKLDCWPTYFRAVASGLKTFEVRKNDRFFQCGDTVELVELREDRLKSHTNPPTGKRLTFIIGPVLQGGQFGIEPGYCVFSLLSAAAVEGSDA
jgi:hypothetical protein